jgi:outer membrane protein TolC
MRAIFPGALAVSVLFGAAGGCQLFTADADREVYSLVDKRQEDAVGVKHDARIDHAKPERTKRSTPPQRQEPYAFVPNPASSEVPKSFQTPASQPGEQGGSITDVARRMTEQAAKASTTQPGTRELELSEALAYAFQHARDFQTAKEELYIAALDLTLERHLWTPLFVGEVSTLYTDPPSESEFDQTLETIAQLGVEQRLPYGGTLTAQTVNTLVRDLAAHTTSGESGEILLEADIPLLRGAGRVAYESRYQAERDLSYAVRTFERFRRSFAVDVAAEYFALQSLRQRIGNAEQSIAGFGRLAEQSRALWEAGRRIQLEVQRAEQDLLVATNDKVDAIEAYQTSLDQFKIRIGMPTEMAVDVRLPPEVGVEEPAGGASKAEPLVDEIRMPDVDEDTAIRVALEHRLDLLNDFDRIGDAVRGVKIAENDILPDLRASSSVLFGTRPDHLSTTKYTHEETDFTAGLTLELPLDRKAERNALRAAQISKQQADRAFNEARDTVIFQVRRAMRRVRQQESSLAIQIINRDLALVRRRAAEIRAIKGELSNRDVVEAENALLNARNRLAQAQAAYRTAILEFWRDTATLQVDDDGRWRIQLAGKPSGGNTDG